MKVRIRPKGPRRKSISHPLLFDADLPAGGALVEFQILAGIPFAFAEIGNERKSRRTMVVFRRADHSWHFNALRLQAVWDARNRTKK